MLNIEQNTSGVTARDPRKDSVYTWIRVFASATALELFLYGGNFNAAVVAIIPVILLAWFLSMAIRGKCRWWHAVIWSLLALFIGWAILLNNESSYDFALLLRRPLNIVIWSFGEIILLTIAAVYSLILRRFKPVIQVIISVVLVFAAGVSAVM